MYEQEKIELLGQKVSLARDMISDKILPYNWVYDNVFNFSDKEKVEIESQIIDDQKQNSDTHRLKWKVMTQWIPVRQSVHQVVWRSWYRTRRCRNTTRYSSRFYI